MQLFREMCECGGAPGPGDATLFRASSGLQTLCGEPIIKDALRQGERERERGRERERERMCCLGGEREGGGEREREREDKINRRGGGWQSEKQ